MDLLDNISAAAAVLTEKLKGFQPRLALVAGSGLADSLTGLREHLRLSLSELPGFPDVAVAGQRSEVSAGILGGCEVLVFFGRYHVYEGYNAWQVTAQVRLAAAVGCRKLLLTNAVGGIAPDMHPGDIMLVTDHLNFSGHHPLIGRPQPPFFDLCGLYHQFTDATPDDLLEQYPLRLHRGVLAWMAGPTYETPAEIRFLEQAGAAAVTMSTVPEAIVGRYCGLEVCALSLITNYAAGKGQEALHHDHVVAVGRDRAVAMATLLNGLVPRWLENAR